MNVANLWRRVGWRGLWHLGVYTLQRRRSDYLHHPPLYAQIEVTRGCNLQCRVCGLSHYHVKAGHMSLAEFKHILDQLEDVQEVMLQGLGEPLLNSDFTQMVEAAKARGLRVDTSTNATLLTRETAEALIQAGLDVMSVSIDGTTAKTYESIRRGASFDSVIGNVRRMAELKQEQRVNHPKLNIGYILTNDNYRELPDLVSLAQRIGVEKINVWHLQGGDTYGDIGNLSLEGQDIDAVEHVLNEASRLAAHEAIDLTLPPLERVYNAPNCKWPWWGTYITWEGYVTPCCIQCYPEIHNLGNIHDESMQKIWNGTPYRRLRSQLRSGDYSFFCQGCPYDVSWQARLRQKPAGKRFLVAER